jgi:hypothetical protein
MKPMRRLWRAVGRFESRVCHAFELWAGYDFTWRDAWDTAGDWN